MQLVLQDLGISQLFIEQFTEDTSGQWDWGNLGRFQSIHSNIYVASTMCQKLKRQIPESACAYNIRCYQPNKKIKCQKNF